MAVVDELVTVLGIKLAGDALAKLKTFKDGLSSVASSVMGLSTIIAGSVTAAGMYIKSVADQSAALDTLSQKTGLSTDELQAWSYAAAQAGVDGNALMNDLQGLRDKFGGTGKQAEAMLLRMADSFSKMSAAQARNYGKAWGLSDDTIMLLRKGRDGLAELKKQAHDVGAIIPESSIKVAAAFQKKLSELSFIMRSLGSQVAIATIPALTQLVDIFKEFIIKNREWISIGLESIMGGLVGGFDRFLSVIKKVTGFFDPIIAKVKEFLPEMSGVEFVTHLVTGALTGLLIIFSPIIAKTAAIAAGLAALSLVFEDLFTFVEGGESTIGHFFDAFKEDFPDLFALLERLYNWFKGNIEPALTALKDAAIYVGQGFAELGREILSMYNSIAGPIMKFFDTFDERFPALSRALSGLGNLLGNVLKAGFDVAISAAKAFIGVIGDVLGFIGKAIEKVSAFLDMLFSAEEKQRTVTVQEKNDTLDALINTTKMPLDQQATLPTSQQASPQAQAQAQSAAANGGSSKTEINDNKTINLTVSTSDPAQAAQQMINMLNDSSVNTNTPGDFAPRAM